MTDFTRRIYEVVKSIPAGRVRSYGRVAALAGNTRGARGVGFALHRNPEPGVIPCHRVIGADGRLVGYGGGLDIKEALLQLERRMADRD